MSAPSRWIIAIFSVFCAVMFASMSSMLDMTGQQKVAQWSIAGFCLLIAVACFPGRGRAVAVRIIGAVVFMACIGYIVSEWGQPLPQAQDYSRSDTNIVNAILAFLVFGLPGGYVAITGKFPRWTMLGDKLHGSEKSDI